jgi:hypothetical protein
MKTTACNVSIDPNVWRLVKGILKLTVAGLMIHPHHWRFVRPLGIARPVFSRNKFAIQFNVGPPMKNKGYR